MSNTDRSSQHAEAVSRRAYQIWEDKGRPDGAEQEHWYQAERDLIQTGTPSLAAEIANDPKPLSSPGTHPAPAALRPKPKTKR